MRSSRQRLLLLDHGLIQYFQDQRQLPGWTRVRHAAPAPRAGHSHAAGRLLQPARSLMAQIWVDLCKGKKSPTCYGTERALAAKRTFLELCRVSHPTYMCLRRRGRVPGVVLHSHSLFITTPLPFDTSPKLEAKASRRPMTDEVSWPSCATHLPDDVKAHLWEERTHSWRRIGGNEAAGEECSS